MGSPAIFSGSFTNLLTSRGILESNGTIIDYNGPINYISNYGAEIGTTGWATYSNTAANIPSTGTGGTATGLTFSRNTSTPLSGLGDFSMVQTNSTNIQGKGVSYDFTINSDDQGQVLSIQFNYNASSTFVASNGTTAPLNDGTTTTNAGNSDIEVFIYDKTNTVLIPVSPQVITANGSNNWVFKGTFQTASNSTSYRLIFHVATTSANATGWTFKFDNVFVGPQPISFGAPVTDWTAYTLTIGGSISAPTPGTNTATAYWRRVGDSMQIKYQFIQTSTGSNGSGDYLFPLPNGYIIDTNKVSVGTGGSDMVARHVGTASLRAGVSGFSLGMVFPYNSTNLGIYSYGTGSTTMNIVGQASTWFNLAGNANTDFGFLAIVPIQGWSSSTLMSNDASTRVVAAKYYLSSNTAPSSGNQINYDTKVYDTHAAVTTGALAWKFTAPVSGFYRVSATSQPTASTATDYTLYKNGSVVGNLFNSNAANLPFSGSTSIQLVSGDYIDIRLDSAVTLTGSSTSPTYIAIEQIQGPSNITVVESINASYYLTTNATPGANAIFKLDTKLYDSHNAYSTSTGNYTIPVSGKYRFTLNGQLTTAGTNGMYLVKNGTAYAYLCNLTTNSVVSGSMTVPCIAGDTVSFFGDTGSRTIAGGTVNGAYQTIMSVERVGN